MRLLTAGDRAVRPSLLLGALTLAVAVMGAEGLRADTFIEQEVRYTSKRGEEGETVEHQRYWLSKDRARLEQGEEAYLVDSRSGNYFYLDLKQRHFDRHPSPFTLDALVPAEYVDAARRSFEERMPTNVNMFSDETMEEIDGRLVRHVRLQAGAAGDAVMAVLDLWVSPDLWPKVAYTAYRRLQADRLSTSPFTAWMVEPLQSLEGFPVKEVVSLDIHGQKTRYTRVLLSIEEGVAVPNSVYEVPEGFTPFPEAGPKIVPAQ